MIKCGFKLGMFAGNDLPVVPDTTAPVVTAPASQSMQYEFGSGGLTHADLASLMANATAVDSVDGSVVVSNNLSLLPNPIAASTIVITFSATDAAGNTGTAQMTLEITESAEVTLSNYTINSTNLIAPAYGATPPEKMVPFIDPETGITITRMTNAAADMQQSDDSLNGYSRYSQENSDGVLYLSQGANSTSSAVLEKTTGNVVAYLAADDSGVDTKTIGTAHEIRWDRSGKNAKRIYFVDGCTFNQINDVTQNDNSDRSNPTRSQIKDFESLVTWPAGATSKKIYNDQEGGCSDDSDHWVFMAAYYDGSNFRVAAFIHYQISTDQAHYLYPSDLAGTDLAGWSGRDYFPKRPNMVEVSPLATGIVIHTGRSYSGSFGAGDADDMTDTLMDGPHLWPLDFDHQTTEVFKIAGDETHSGWAWAEDGRELFVYQDNRRDLLCATFISGVNKGYALGNSPARTDDSGLGTIDFADHAAMDYTNLHFARMPSTKKGWVMMSTYKQAASGNWSDNQILMFELKDRQTTPDVWRVSPLYNAYEGDYFDEAPASMSMDGQSVYVSNNWGVAGGDIEVYRYDLPETWHSDLLNVGSPLVVDQAITVEQAQDIIITLGEKTHNNDNVVYGVSGTSNYTVGPETNQITFNTTDLANETFTINANSGNGAGYSYATITMTVTATDNNIAPVISDQNLTVVSGQNLTITLGGITDNATENQSLTYTVTGSGSLNYTPLTSNTGVFNFVGTDTQVLEVTADDGNGGTDTATITIIVTSVPQVAPEDVQFGGWSLLYQNGIGDASLPSGTQTGSVPNLLAEMYLADNLTLNTYPTYIPSGTMEALDEAAMVSAVQGAASDALLISGHTTQSADDPVGPPSWFGNAEALADVAIADGKLPLWYQGWLQSTGSNGDPEYANLVTNFENLKASKGGVILKTAEVYRYLQHNYPQYWDDLAQPLTTPITGMHTDSVHGSYALYYLAAMTMYKALTGINAKDAQYVVPAFFAMGQDFINRINESIDAVQDDFYTGITGETFNAPPSLLAQTGTVEVGKTIDFNLGPSTDADGDTVAYTVSSGSNYVINGTVLTYTGVTAGENVLNVVATDSNGQQNTETITIDVTEVVATTGTAIWFTAGDGTASGPNGEVVNAMNMRFNTTVDPVLDTDGNATTVTISYPTAIETTVETAVGTDTGFLADVLMVDSLYSTNLQNDPLTIAMAGLKSNTDYVLRYTGSRTGGTGREQYITVNGDPYTFDAGSNRANGVIAAFTTDANGTLTITAASADTGGNGYMYFSGMTLTEV